MEKRTQKKHILKMLDSNEIHKVRGGIFNIMHHTRQITESTADKDYEYSNGYKNSNPALFGAYYLEYTSGNRIRHLTEYYC